MYVVVSGSKSIVWKQLAKDGMQQNIRFSLLQVTQVQLPIMRTLPRVPLTSHLDSVHYQILASRHRGQVSIQIHSLRDQLSTKRLMLTLFTILDLMPCPNCSVERMSVQLLQLEHTSTMPTTAAANLCLLGPTQAALTLQWNFHFRI